MINNRKEANYNFENDTIDFNIDGIFAKAVDVDDEAIGRILWFNRGNYQFDFDNPRFAGELVAIVGGEPELRIRIDGVERAYFCNDELVSNIFEELLNEIDDYGTYDDEE